MRLLLMGQKKLWQQSENNNNNRWFYIAPFHYLEELEALYNIVTPVNEFKSALRCTEAMKQEYKCQHVKIRDINVFTLAYEDDNKCKHLL